MDQTDLTNRVQRTADWLRRGVNPNSNGTEEGISKGLDQLSQQVHQAQQGLGAGKPSQGQQAQGEQTAALDHIERFRDQVESLTGRGQNPLGRQPDNRDRLVRECGPAKLESQGQRTVRMARLVGVRSWSTVASPGSERRFQSARGKPGELRMA
jgi:hypothetical protein